MSRVVVFDVCGTLYSSNTTFDFVKFYHRKESNLFKLFFVTLLTSFFGKVINKFLGVSIREMIISTLSGESLCKVNSCADEFTRNFLIDFKIDSIFKLFDEEKLRPNTCIILASASIDPVIKAIAKFLEVDFFATKLEVINGLFSGKIENDLKGQKCRFLTDIKMDFFASDNKDDFLVGLKSCKYLIVTKNKNLEYWKGKVEGKENNDIKIAVV